jgi:hypothetical protein
MTRFLYRGRVKPRPDYLLPHAVTLLRFGEMRPHGALAFLRGWRQAASPEQGYAQAPKVGNLSAAS